ncbi:class I lanthipeptide [Hymenobacter aquaticus]|uniref:class I lanthipeptide n=1 Tax=Hymenobacter aquaticus TaxID=1867101 RepID=UPI001436BFEB|nr:class I lanthipeptide [Hymenobacter aquaticus]
MKKKQITRKLSLNKQTLSLLDPRAMSAVKGGLVEVSLPDKPTSKVELSCGCC